MEAESDFIDPKTGEVCDHGIVFDEALAKDMNKHEVREKFPRLFGDCPKGCGFSGIGYASWAHYVCGDW